MQGPYSLEMRLNGKGAYPLDATCRAGSPPTGLLCHLYGKSYAEAVWSLANGEMPVIEPDAYYGCEIILASAWYRDNELHVGMSKDIEPYIMLKNAVRRNGQYYCIPNDPSGSDGIFGSLVATGESVKDAISRVKDMLNELEVTALDYDHELFDKATEQMEAGKRYGVDFG